MNTLLSLFLASILLLPVQFALSPANDIDLAVMRIIGIALFCALIILLLSKKKLHIPLSLQSISLISIFLLAALSLLFAQHTSWGVRKLLFLLTLFPFFYAAYIFIITNRNAFHKITHALVYSGAFAALIGIVQFGAQFFIGLDGALVLWQKLSGFFLGGALSQSVAAHNSWLVSVGGIDFFRVVGFFPDPHMCAFFLGMILPLAIGLFVTTKKRIFLFIGFLIFFAALLTFSRGGYVGILSAVGASLFLMRGAFSFMQKTVALSTISFLFVVLFLFPQNPVTERFTSSFLLSEGSNVERVANWKQAYDAISRYPLTGTGLGNYSAFVLPSAAYRDPIYAHNLYLDVAAELGIFGFFFLIVLIGATLRTFVREQKQGNVLCLFYALSIIIFCAHALFDTPLFSVHIFTLLMILVGVSAGIAQRQHSKL